jgi:DNA repair protein RadA/Sms
MPKIETIFTCSNCGAQFQKWVGRCLECGKWGTVEKGQITNAKAQNDEMSIPAKTVKLSEVGGKNFKRITTGISELDRVLGGGIVPGSLILLGGEPGIGKSTLSLQLAAVLPNTFYFSAEESAEQIKLRADRLGITAPTLQLANEPEVEKIVATLTPTKKDLSTPLPGLVIIDSIQTLYSNDVEGEPGNINQIRACTVKLLELAKTSSIPIVIIGHVTKEGTVAGPKTLEHLVDTVLYLEGDQHHLYRILRTVKNRFGATDEVGIFQMEEKGLTEVRNASAFFMAERGEDLPGAILTCLVEGTRPIIVEIQALVNKTAFGFPIRKSSGFDLNRLHVLIAVLQKRAGLHLEQYDVHINVVGGLTADEPAADLAVAMAIASAYKDKPLGHDLVVFGEVGLGGEVRSIPQLEKRIREAQQLGLKRVITNTSLKVNETTNKIKTIRIKNIQEIIKHT